MTANAAAMKLNQTPVFLATFFLGSFCVLIGKLVPVLYPVLGILVPLLLIVGYAWVNSRVGFLDSTRAQVADNAYFLGFLYFLVSLAITLAQVRYTSGPERTIEVEPIIRGFGIALATTIAGLATRIVLLQNVAGLASAREKAEESLLLAVNRFRDDMMTGVDLLRQARDASIQSTREAALVVRLALEETVKGTRDGVGEATTAYVDGLLLTAKTTGEQLAVVVSELRTRISGIELPANLLTARLKPPLDALVSTVEKITAATASIESDLAQQSNDMRKFHPRMEKILAALQSQSESFDELVKRVNASGESVAHFGDTTQSTADSLGKILTDLRGITAELGYAPQGANTAIQALEDVKTSAVAMSQSVSAALQGTANDVHQLVAQTKALQAEMQHVAAMTQAGMAGLAARLQELNQIAARNGAPV